MITWSDGATSGKPLIQMPKRPPVHYLVDMFSYGYHPLWCVEVSTRGFPVARDHFKERCEAYEFLEVVVNLLAVKYPDAVCSNFSFLTKE